MKRCVACDAELEPFLCFGRMPRSNAFLREDQFDSEYFFNLEVALCASCRLVQLTEHVERAAMFHEGYAYRSSSSSSMIEHFARFAESIERFTRARKSPFIVEIGCNDGVLIGNFARNRVRHLGLDPAGNVAQAARDNGIHVWQRFFQESSAEDILAEYGKADVVVAANMMCHVPYIGSVLSGVRRVLQRDGLFFFEDPYLGEIIANTAFDQIYDEHALYFSVTSVRNLVQGQGLELVEAIPQSVHGGSMRYTVAHRGQYSVSGSVDTLLAAETVLGLDQPVTFGLFRNRVEQLRNNMLSFLNECREQHKRVMGYGATAKSATAINFCGITREHVESITDTTIEKVGKFTPGAHIPVVSREAFLERYPDYALLFAWNHSNEIMCKESEFAARGGRWVTYVPEVRLVDGILSR
jgi:methylation protein EvaC